ncbi:976_t:CDS:1, partial [Dentiscutata heterogama]
RSHLFGENGPDQDWWTQFMRDYSELSFCVSQELSEVYTQKANK